MAELPLVGMYDWFKAEGLPVVIGYKDWATYGRPYSFSVRGSIAHHTASPLTSSEASNRNVVTYGNSVAPGPIAHCLLQRSVKLELIAAGRCNHAGAGWWPLGKDTANMYGFAIEPVNNGTGEYWQTEFVEVMARAYAVIHRQFNIDISNAWTHAAYAPTRKIDPAGPAVFRQSRPGTWTNEEWRNLVSQYLTPTPAPEPPPIIITPPTEVEDMNLYNAVYTGPDAPGMPSGSLWVGNGLQRYHVPTWEAWDNMYLRAAYAGGTPVLNLNGQRPANRDNVTRTGDPNVIHSLGKAV